MSSRLFDYLDHIQQAAADACTFIEGLSKEAFLSDKRTQSAVVMCLVVIGEAATKVMDQYPEFSDGYPDIPWRSMRGMRNRIAHGYFEINLDVVWDTVRTALPELLGGLTTIRKSRESGNDLAQS